MADAVVMAGSLARWAGLSNEGHSQVAGLAVRSGANQRNDVV